MSCTFWDVEARRSVRLLAGEIKRGNGLEVPCNYHFSGGKKLIDGWLFACFTDWKNLDRSMVVTILLITHVQMIIALFMLQGALTR